MSRPGKWTPEHPVVLRPQHTEGSAPPCASSPAGIAVILYVSVDHGVTWYDANTVTGPTTLVATQVMLKYVVNNTGNVPLSNVILSSDAADLGTQSQIGTLPVGGSAVISTTPNTANVVGQYTKTAVVVSTYTDDLNVTLHPTDTNPANAFFSTPGVRPPIPPNRSGPRP